MSEIRCLILQEDGRASLSKIINTAQYVQVKLEQPRGVTCSRSKTVSGRSQVGGRVLSSLPLTEKNCMQFPQVNRGHFGTRVGKRQTSCLTDPPSAYWVFSNLRYALWRKWGGNQPRRSWAETAHTLTSPTLRDAFFTFVNSRMSSKRNRCMSRVFDISITCTHIHTITNDTHCTRSAILHTRKQDDILLLASQQMTNANVKA